MWRPECAAPPPRWEGLKRAIRSSLMWPVGTTPHKSKRVQGMRASKESVIMERGTQPGCAYGVGGLEEG